MEFHVICKYLFDGEDLSENKVITIKDNLIMDIRDALYEEEYNAEDQKVLKCYFLMPGLIDAHVHITGYTEKYLGINPYLPVENFLKLLIARGITSVRDTGNSVETMLYAKKWCKENYNISIKTSGPILDNLPLTWAFSRIVDNEANIKQQIYMLSQQEVDFIKVYKNVNADLIKIIVEEAQKYNLYVAIDSPNVNTITQIESGVRTIEHLFNLINCKGMGKNVYEKFESVNKYENEINKILKSMKDNKIYLCPTLLTILRLLNPELMIKEENLDFMSTVMPYHKYIKQMQSKMGYFFGKKYMNEALHINPHIIKQYSKEKIYENIATLIKKIDSEKINLLMGTDAPNPTIVPGFSLHEEMKLWDRYGIDRTKILRTVTAGNARVINSKVGKIRSNMKADLLMLNSNPLENIDNISDIKAVIINGKVVDDIELSEGS